MTETHIALQMILMFLVHVANMTRMWIYSPCMDFANTDPEEKEPDRNLRAYHGYGVEQIAEIPGMPCLLYAVGRQIVVMASGSIVYTDARRS